MSIQCDLVKGAGHSAAEEQSEQVNRILIEFFRIARQSSTSE
jgi:pimeloyl-ACP methyl ester carboxylesterase